MRLPRSSVGRPLAAFEGVTSLRCVTCQRERATQHLMGERERPTTRAKASKRQLLACDAEPRAPSLMPRSSIRNATRSKVALWSSVKVTLPCSVTRMEPFGVNYQDPVVGRHTRIGLLSRARCSRARPTSYGADDNNEEVPRVPGHSKAPQYRLARQYSGHDALPADCKFPWQPIAA
jgi:hypothetical protein